MSYINNFNPRRMIWFNQSAPLNKMDLWLSYNRHNSEDDSDTQVTDNPNQRNCDLILKAWDCGEWIPIVGFNTTSANKINIVKNVQYSCTMPDNISYSATGYTKFHLPLFRDTDDSPDELFDAGTIGGVIQHYVSSDEWGNIFDSNAFLNAWSNNLNISELLYGSFDSSLSVRKGWNNEGVHARKPNFVLNGTTSTQNRGRFIKLKDPSDSWWTNQGGGNYGEQNNCFDWVEFVAGSGVTINTVTSSGLTTMTINSTGGGGNYVEGSGIDISGNTISQNIDRIDVGTPPTPLTITWIDSRDKILVVGSGYTKDIGLYEIFECTGTTDYQFSVVSNGAMFNNTNPIYMKINAKTISMSSGTSFICCEETASGNTIPPGNYLVTLQFGTLKFEKIRINS